MTKPTTPYQPYAAVHANPQGEGDARPTALQIVQDCGGAGALRGKTVVITGCTAGIGVETARAMYATGAQLFLMARDMTKLETVIKDIVTHNSSGDSKATPRPQAVELHLDSLDSVRAAAADFQRRAGSQAQLHMLIENAGVMAVPLGHTRDGFETHMGVNHFAHFLLFQLLKPQLLAGAAASGRASRVVVLSSAAHRRAGVQLDDLNWAARAGEYGKWQAYGQSKTANIFMAAAIDRHYAAQGLTAVSVHPGGVNTDLMRYLPAEEIEALELPKYANSYKSIAQGAATTVWAALSPHFEGRNGGRYLGDCGECGPLDAAVAFASGYAAHVYDEETEEKLWKLSYEAVGLPVED